MRNHCSEAVSSGGKTAEFRLTEAGLACKRKSRKPSSMKEGGAPLLEEELEEETSTGFQRRENLFSLRICPLVVEP